MAAEAEGITRDFLAAATEADFRELLKDVFQKVGVESEAFESIFKETEIKQINGEWHIGERPFGEVEFHLRSGRIGQFMKEIKLNGSAITEEMEQNFRKTVLKNSPEVRLADLEDEVKQFKEKVPELDAKIDDLKDMNEKVQEKVAKAAEKNKWLSPGTAAKLAALGGLVGALISAIIKETKNLRGCYLYTTLNGVTNHCKLMDRTIDPENYNQCVASNEGLKYNLNLTLRRVKKDAAELERKYNLSPLLSILGISRMSELKEEEIPAKIRVKTKELNNFFKNKEIIIGNISELLLDDERNKICVACDPSAPIDSIDYVDTTGLPTNKAYSCQTNPTIIDAIAKFSGDGASEIIDDIAKAAGLHGILSWLAQFVLLIIVVVLIGKFLIERYGHKIPFLKKFAAKENGGEDVEMKPLAEEESYE